MSMPELISIITPAYQAQKFLVSAVESVVSQTHNNWEMLVVADDGMDYHSILKNRGIHDPRIRFFSSPAIQSGPSLCRNIALKQAQGQWISILDADDVYYPQRLTLLLAAAQSTGLALDNLVMASGEEFQIKEKVLTRESGKFYFDDFTQSLVPLVFLFHKSLLNQGWDEDINRGEDILVNLRALEQAKYAQYLSQPLYEYRVHDQSMCHAPGADELFIESYRYAIERLQTHGLGFISEEFKQRVLHFLKSKALINQKFNQAVKEGYRGNYQQFVKSSQLR